MFLALIVLAAQLGAQAHAYSHLAAAPDTPQHHVRALPCVECSSFAPLLTVAGGLSHLLIVAVADPAKVHARLAAAVHHAAISPAHRSRAPPTLS